MKSVRHVTCQSCGGLRGFLTERDAEKALGRAQSKRARVRGTQMETRYFEGPCGLWHLTSVSAKHFRRLAVA